MEILNYLAGASICMALCYLPYTLLFKKLTFFRANRFYLLFIVVASLIIPALHIRVTEPLAIRHTDQHIAAVYNSNIETDHPFALAEQQFYLNRMQIAYLSYFVVCFFMLARMLYSIFKIIRQAISSGAVVGNIRLVENQHANNSSFFNIIFLQSKNANGIEIDQVLTHEKAHVRLFHSADNLFIEMVKVFFWFNPFIYLIARALKEVHEFEVDHAVKNMFGPAQYATLLVKLSADTTINLTNQFSAYSLKSRIKMMFKPRSSRYKKWCYLLILPLLLVTGYLFSVERVYGGTPVKKDFVLVIDAGHGGKELGAAGIGGRYEKDMSLLLVKQIRLVAEQRGIRIILTRSDDRFLDFHDRVDNKADAFISIHMNATGRGLMDKKAHGIYVMVDTNTFYPQSKKLAANVMSSLLQLNGLTMNHNVKLYESSQRLYTLSHNKAPAIIVEMGYITNKNDLNYVLDTDNQHTIAEKIIDGVIAYGSSN